MFHVENTMQVILGGGSLPEVAWFI